MRIFKTKNFVRWAKKEKVKDSALCQAIQEIQDGMIDADLGSGLLKKRVARPGQGKRGGYRTLIAFKHPHDKNAFFIFGFSKNERDNISQDEKEVYKKLAEFYIGLNAAQLKKLLEQETLFEVSYEYSKKDTKNEKNKKKK